MLIALATIALAEPHLGGEPLPSKGEWVVEPGTLVWPVNGYGGSVVPDLFVGYGASEKLDFRLGAGLDVPVYHFDDGGVFWGYTDPSLDRVELLGRHTWRDVGKASSVSLGLRAGGENLTPLGKFSLGPEAEWRWPKPWGTLSYRMAFLVTPEYLPSYWGLLDTAIGFSVPVKRSSLFVDLAPWVGLGLGSYGNSGAIFMPWPGFTADAGAWVPTGKRSQLAMAVRYVADWGMEPEDFQLYLRWRLALGG